MNCILRLLKHFGRDESDPLIRIFRSLQLQFQRSLCCHSKSLSRFCAVGEDDLLFSHWRWAPDEAVQYLQQSFDVTSQNETIARIRCEVYLVLRLMRGRTGQGRNVEDLAGNQPTCWNHLSHSLPCWERNHDWTRRWRSEENREAEVKRRKWCFGSRATLRRSINLERSANPERVAGVDGFVWSTSETTLLSQQTPSLEAGELFGRQRRRQLLHENERCDCAERRASYTGQEQTGNEHSSVMSQNSNTLQYLPWVSKPGACENPPS